MSTKGAQKSTKGVIHIHCLFSFYLTYRSSLLPLGIIQTSLILLSLTRSLHGVFYLSSTPNEPSSNHYRPIFEGISSPYALPMLRPCYSLLMPLLVAVALTCRAKDTNFLSYSHRILSFYCILSPEMSMTLRFPLHLVGLVRRVPVNALL